MAYHQTNTHTPYDVRMLAAADRLFTDFDHLAAKAVFTAIAAARTTLRQERGSVVPDPNQVERLARERLRRQC